MSEGDDAIEEEGTRHGEGKIGSEPAGMTNKSTTEREPRVNANYPVDGPRSQFGNWPEPSDTPLTDRIARENLGDGKTGDPEIGGERDGREMGPGPDHPDSQENDDGVGSHGVR